MKVVRLSNGYRIRLNNSEMAALQSLVAQALAIADIEQQARCGEPTRNMQCLISRVPLNAMGDNGRRRDERGSERWLTPVVGLACSAQLHRAAGVNIRIHCGLATS